MRKELLAGLSALALMLGASGAALANGGGGSGSHGAVANVGGSEAKGIGGGTTFDDGNAVAANGLMQVAAGTLAGGDINSHIHSQLADDLTFSSNSFNDQAAFVSNASSAVNTAQQGAVAIAGAVTVNP